MDSLKQLQELLRDLFQLDLADLDFGLYRLLRIKQKEVESFLSDQLPRRVEEAFHSVTGEQLSILESDISKLSIRIKEEIGEDALLSNGEIKPDYRDTKIKAARSLIAGYEKAREQLQAMKATEEQKSEVFNHLYAFFSRYYESGDFIPRRRYGVREAYAIPYNGEETFFHWANKDQHYVKTGETFRDYAYQLDTMSGPCHVRFLLAEASLPPGNTKGDTRYFFPLPDQVSWEKEIRTLKIQFHYRLPTGEEIEKWGKNSKLQETVLNTSLPKILEAVPEFTLRSALSEVVEEKNDQKISLLLKRMRHFCRRNTTDYFIHRDLEGFLKRELEFYLKDQVLHLADMEGDLEAKRRTIRVIRQLAEEVIAFLAQIEHVQKRLFEKKKFVLRTDYLVPIKEVSHELWRDVLENEAQLEAWRDLFAIDPKKDLFNQKGKINEQFIKDHPTLVVNTAHFSPAFKEQLLAAFNDLDEATDGLLIHSENYQALRFLEGKYAGQVKCIYIDPPYNTGSDEFIYKDRYRHSTWLAMMEERLILTGELLSGNGMIFVSIDDNEQVHLKGLMEEVFGEDHFLASAIWQKVYSPRMDAKGFSEDHDYIIIFGGEISRVPFEQNIDQFVLIDSETGKRYRRRSLRKEGSNSRRQDRPNLFYSIPAPDNKPVYPIRPDGTEGCWRWGPEKYKKAFEDGFIEWVKTEQGWEVYAKQFVEENATRPPSTIWLHEEAGHNHEATETLKHLFGKKVFENPKPPRLVQYMHQIAASGKSDLTFDFFAGSGTTGHAVINLNREDGNRRKFILVDMANFESVLLPRIQKVIFAPEWKEGIPKRLPTKDELKGTPRLVKVLRFESYEDALHNLVAHETLKREELRAGAHREKLGEDAYRLHYLARLPLESSASMLNLAALEHPFSYKIEVLTDDGPKVETVDLIETFNFLYGLHVQKMTIWTNEKDKRIYKAVKGKNGEGKPVLVLWRDMENLNPVLERHFLESKIKAEGPFEEALINGDTATPGVKSLDGLFKRLMEEEEK